MADVVDAQTRSRMMSGIRGSNTRPEIGLRKALHARGLRFRIHVPTLPGRPDIVLPRWKAVVMVHGCFWHRHAGCRFATTPSTRPEFWATKFVGNINRDARNMAELRQAGWRVAIVWECALRSQGNAQVAQVLCEWLSDSSAGGSALEIG